MCEAFKIFLNFKEVVIQDVDENIENQNVTLSVEFLDNQVDASEEAENVILVDGCQVVKQNFIFQPENVLENEEFEFKALGSFLRVKLSLLKQVSVKSKRKPERIALPFAEGFINLLLNLKYSQNNNDNSSQFDLKPLDNENTKISLKYDIQFENPPQIHSTFLVHIESIHNFPANENIEACFRFPYNQNFRAALMHKINVASNCNQCLLDNYLMDQGFCLDANPAKIDLFYENFQTQNGLNLLHNLIMNHENLLIELKLNDKMYMIFIDLTVFNYPGVSEVNFLVPLYEWNNKIILDKFQHEACLLTDESTKKRSRKSIKGTETPKEEVLVPIIENEKLVALKIHIKFSEVVHCAHSLECLYDKLNEKFPYILDIPEEEAAVEQSKRDYRCIVNQMASVVEKFIDQNSKLCNQDLTDKFKKLITTDEFCIKNEFKEALKALIGNTFNRETQTLTNHDFKLLMMKAFKSLSRETDEILIQRHSKKSEQKEVLSDRTRKWQMEEYLSCKKHKQAEKLLGKEFKQNLSETILKEEAIYLIKLKKFDELEDVLKKLLRIHKYCTFSLYLVSYLFMVKQDTCATILILEILARLKPNSMEIWILLSELYKKTEYIPGVLFCRLKISDSKFISNFSRYNSVIHPEFVFIEPTVNIQWCQFSSSLNEFLNLTKQYLTRHNCPEFYENLIFKIIELTDNSSHKEALELFKEISINDENEAAMRILKGNILYQVNEKWRAVCEYEIAFNLLQNSSIFKFPMIPALRCGQWFLSDMENLIKSQKYFQYCVRIFGTYDSYMGLGKVYVGLKDYSGAEKCFAEANSIDNESYENWVFLALTQSKLKNHDMTLNCYLMAKEFGSKDCKELIEIEKYLNI